MHVTGYGGFPKGLEAWVGDGRAHPRFRVCESAIDDYRKEVEEEGNAA